MIGRSFPEMPAKSYAELRGELRNGDVLICSGSGVFSAMIQAVTESDWSHVGLILRLDFLDRVMLLESVEPIGVRTVRLSKYLEDYDGNFKPYPGGLAVIRHKEFARQVTDKQLVPAMRRAIDQFGRPYDKGDIARIAGRILAARIPFTAQQQARVEQDQEFICSEYVGMFYHQVGLAVRYNRLGFLSPADFAEDPAFELVGVLKNG